MDKWVSGPADLIFISQPDLTWERSPGFASAELHLSVERTAEATDPLHLQGFSYGKESGRESHPGPCFLFTAEPLCSRGSSVILFTWAHTHVKCKGCTGHWRSWYTVPTWHYCWHVSAQSPPLSRTAQPHSEIITWRLNTTCFYPCVPLQHKSTWTWREADNAIRICEQTEDQTLPAVWLSNVPKMCKGTNKTVWWNMLTRGFACHWVGIYCTVWGKSALHDLVWARSGFL